MVVRDNEIQISKTLLEGGFGWEYGCVGGLFLKRRRKDIPGREIAGLMSRTKLGSVRKTWSWLHERWEGEDRGGVH